LNTLQRAFVTVAVAAAAVLAHGCGFELRRTPEFQFRTIQLRGFADNSALARELKRSLAENPGTQVVEGGAAAQVVLEALSETREKTVVASTAAGQVREVQLRIRFNFRLRTASGKELLAATEILLVRDMSYNESSALAKEQEEALLYTAMQSDIVAQVMRRLAAVAAP
jgi:LPS-assembly lipoprotein